MRVLSLDRAERSAIAHEIRRYQDYRVRIGDDLHASHVLVGHGETDPPDITPQVEGIIDAHYGIAEQCRTLAGQFDADGPVQLTRATLSLVSQIVSNAFADNVPSELARIDEFATAALSELADPTVAAPTAKRRKEDWFFVVSEETQPEGLRRGALINAGSSIAGERLQDRVAYLSERVDALAAQLEDQQHYVDGLRKAADRRSTLTRQVDPFALSDLTTIETPRASTNGMGL